MGLDARIQSKYYKFLLVKISVEVSHKNSDDFLRIKLINSWNGLANEEKVLQLHDVYFVDIFDLLDADDLSSLLIALIT
jgi:hypothetical protein